MGWVAIWMDPHGKLWVFYSQSLEMFDGRAGVCSVTCDNPDAEKPTWSEPRRRWHGWTLNRPTVLSNRDWMLARTQCHFGRRGIAQSLSEDKGATWSRPLHSDILAPHKEGRK